MKQYSRGYAMIDLDAIEWNVQQLKDNLDDNTELIAVIKADGYGHGAMEIAKLLEPLSYVWGFGVASIEEGLLLRSQEIKKPILVLGCIFPEHYEVAIQSDIRFTAYTKEMVEEIHLVGERLQKKAQIHIKLDTGMSRIGFACEKKTILDVEALSKLEYLNLEGVFMHFAKADEVNKDYANQQYGTFTNMIGAFLDNNIQFEKIHCCNSAGIMELPEYGQDIGRAGIAMYGLLPSDEVDKNRIILKPAMSLISHVTFVKELESGVAISYGGTFITDKTTKVATIPIGYADGYPRSLSNVGYVLIKGKKAPIIGRICMDQFMVDVTEIEDVEFGSKVTLLGCDGEGCIAMEELGELANKFNYEFACGISKRIPRVYIKNGQIKNQIDYFA